MSAYRIGTYPKAVAGLSVLKDVKGRVNSMPEFPLDRPLWSSSSSFPPCWRRREWGEGLLCASRGLASRIRSLVVCIIYAYPNTVTESTTHLSTAFWCSSQQSTALGNLIQGLQCSM